MTVGVGWQWGGSGMCGVRVVRWWVLGVLGVFGVLECWGPGCLSQPPHILPPTSTPGEDVPSPPLLMSGAKSVSRRQCTPILVEELPPGAARSRRDGSLVAPLAELLPGVLGIGQCLAELGTILMTIPERIRPKSVEFRPASVELLGHSEAHFAPRSRKLPDADCLWTIFARCWPKSAESRHHVGLQLCRCYSSPGRCRPRLSWNRPHSARVRPIWG